MAKLEKKDKKHIFVICLIYLLIALIITHFEYVFGSKTDWGFQHIVFPDYFRMLFYENYDFFPDFALNIGGGQNIYYFAYYGLFSPIIFISYLLPFMPMGIYIVLISLLIGLFSIYLFYVWIKGFNFSSSLCFILTLIFAMSGPLLFHSHRHIMFVSYMPFLIMGLIGVRRYFSYGYKGLLVISVFLMVMSSYYYSVGGVICLTLYGVYEYLKGIDKFVLKDFLKKGFCFALLVIVGILMSGVILFPVIYALFSGRGESLASVSLIEALTFGVNLDFILYKSYSLGLLGISLLAVVYFIFKKKEFRFLGICLSLMIILPIFVYLLNGFLYLDGKALIPFLPLYVLCTGYFLKEIIDRKVNYKILFIIIVLLVLCANVSDDSLSLYFTLESFFLIGLLFLYKRFQKAWILFIPISLVSIIVCLSVNLGDNLIKSEDYFKENDPKITNIMEDIEESDDGFYRTLIDLKVSSELVNHVYNINTNLVTLYSSTYNQSYSEFFYNFNNNRASRNMFIISEVRNILFEDYMGVKYLITDKDKPFGYSLWKDYGDYQVYINENAFSLGYASDSIMSLDDYEKLDFPDNVLSLPGNIVSKDSDYSYESMAFEVDLEEGASSGIKIERYKEGYKVYSENGGYLHFDLDDDKKLYLLRFTVENPQSCKLGDTFIDVNGVRNKLTCSSWKYFNNNYTFDYTLSLEDGINIEFSPGVHYISKVEMYGLDYDEFIQNLDIDRFNVKKVLGDKISGNIDVSKDGYFHLTIPYDLGFKIKVDGKEIDYEKVNTAFIGFKIEKGFHKIEIEFEAPGALFGKFISIIFGLIFMAILVFDFRRRKKIA